MINHLLVGCTGSIGASNLPNYIIELKKIAKHIKVIMTPTSQEFLHVRVLNSLIGENNVYTDETQLRTGTPLHIELAKWADMAVVVPATLNTMSKVANGVADNLLSMTVICLEGKVMFMPNMNEIMWKSTIMKNNVNRLRDSGFVVIEPVIQKVYTVSTKSLEYSQGSLQPTQLRNAIENIIQLESIASEEGSI